MRKLRSVLEVFVVILCARNALAKTSYETKPPSVVNGRPRSEVDLETEKQFILCAGQNKSLECLSPGSTISIQGAFWGRLSDKICPSEDGDPVTNCENDPATHRIVKGLCDEKRECAVSAKHTVLQSPGTKHCPGVNKYMGVNYTCIPEMRKFVLCNGETTLLHCGQGWKINLLSVYWGRDSPATCPTPLGQFSSCGSVANSLQALTSLCQGREQCRVRADDEHFSLRQDQPHCPAVDKYAVISFRCQPLVTGDDLPSQTKLGDNRNNNSTLTDSTAPLHEESVQLEQNQTAPVLSTQPSHDGAYNITILPIPQYDRNTSAKLAPLFAYLNGDKTDKKESSTPLLVPHDNHTEVEDKSETTATTSGHFTALNSSANNSLPTANKSREDASPEKTQANEQMLLESASLKSHAQNAAVSALQKVPQGETAHDSQTLSTNSMNSSGVLGRTSQGNNDMKDTGKTKIVPVGRIIGAQSQAKEPSTAQRLSEHSTTSGAANLTKLTPQPQGTNLATGKLDDLVPKQSKELCLVNQRHNCPTAVQSLVRPNDSLSNNEVRPQIQTSPERNDKAYWSVLMDLAKQIQNTNKEAETMKTLDEKVHTLEALSNALTTLTSKYLLKEKNEEDAKESYQFQRKEKALRHQKPYQEHGPEHHKAYLLGSLLTGDEPGGLLVPKRRENNAEESMNTGMNSGFLLPKEVDTLENKINQAIEIAEASNRQRVQFPHTPKDGMPLHHLAGTVTKDNNAHLREVSDKLMPQNERKQGAKNIQNVHGIIKTFTKKAVEKGRTRKQGGHPLESTVRNVTLLHDKSLQDGGDSKGGSFDSTVGREVRESAKENGGDVGEQVKNKTSAMNTTIVLTATNTVITPSRGITLGGRINTETQIKTQDIGERLLKTMGTIISRHNKTAIKSTNLQVQGESNCVGVSCSSKQVPQEVSETSPLKSGNVPQTTPIARGQRKSGAERGVKYTDVKTLHPGKRLAVRTGKLQLNLKTMTDLEEGIEKLITKLPNDHRQSDLPKSEALPGAPTDKESGKTSPNMKAVKLLQNIAIQLRKTVYLLGKTKAVESISGEERTENNRFREQMPSGSSSTLIPPDKNRQDRPFSPSRRIHVVRERPKTRNAWGTNSIPHVVDLHSGVTMGKIAGLDESKASDTSVKDASFLSVDKITKIPQFSHVMGENSHRPENVNIGGVISLTDVDKNLASSEPIDSPFLAHINNKTPGLLSIPQFTGSFANGTQAGLALSALGPTQDRENGTAQEGTARLSVDLSTADAGKGELQQPANLLDQNSSAVKELVYGISNLVKLLSRKSEEESGKIDNEEENDQQTTGATSEGMPVKENDNTEYPGEQHMSPDTNMTSMYDDSGPQSDIAANDDYTSNLNNHHVTTASVSTGEADSHFKIDDAGGRYTEYNDNLSDDGNYGNGAFDNHVEDDFNGDDMHDNWDYGNAHAQRRLKSSRSDSRVDSLTDYRPTKKSPLVEEYENLPSQIKDLDDPRVKDDGVLDYVEGIVDKENAEETNDLMNLRPKTYKGAPTRKSFEISQGRPGAIVSPPQI